MNSFIFGAAFITALVLSAALTRDAGADPVRIMVAGLFWTATVALVWHQWVKRSLLYFARFGAFLGTAILVFIVYKSLSREDMFIVCSPGCPPRPGTFWPFLFQWAICLGLASFVIWGTWERFAAGWEKPSLRTFTWSVFIAAWTAACGYLLVRNTSLAVLKQSGKSFIILVGSIVGVIGGLFLIVYLLTLPSRRRAKRETEEFERLDAETKRAVVNQIDTLARRGNWQLVYQRSENADQFANGVARIGGQPLLPTGVEWPKSQDGKPGLFLLQIPLTAQRLGESWRDRLLSIFLVDYALWIVSQHRDDLALSIERAPPGEEYTQKLVRLQGIAVPFKEPAIDDEDGNTGFDTKSLLELNPALKERITALFSRPKVLLARLLNYRSNTSEVSTEDAILVGGNPSLIQGEHDAKCPTCNEPMRFLLQFCDVTEEEIMGDSGVAYVYGCDRHPDQCFGFVDFY